MKRTKRVAWICVLLGVLTPFAGEAFGTNGWIAAEASIELASRKIFYGYALNREPIWVPHAALTFFDALTPGVVAYCDMTDWGDIRRRGPSGYGDRSWKYQEIDPYVKLHHGFTSGEFAWLPTQVYLCVGYQYEYDPPFPNGDTNPDSHYITGCLALPELWLEPALDMEFDVDRDYGAYLNFDIGHSFPIVGCDDSPMLSLRVDIGQGWGNANRNKAYSGVDRAGLMDTMIRLTVEWAPCSWLTIAPYVAYYEFVFDRHLRDGARYVSYGGNSEAESWNFLGGVKISMRF